MRVIHKTESESKTEVRKIQLRYESQMSQRSRDLERRTEELEDKLTQSQDENEEARLKLSKLENVVAD